MLLSSVVQAQGRLASFAQRFIKDLATIANPSALADLERTGLLVDR